ncbi:MAG: LysM peptidoglycan-binding domain-containing protein [Clostridia bacterium]|jgi:LysM repeat protein|nr:LysM peptidoglycan-binding domain-containing protein [Clostridia bacterium]DAO96520.1 MAG TPA: tail assembly protein [Caudoviricetes sp.]
MAYYFYLGNVLLPIPPKKLELKISNQNKTYDLMNYSEINVLKNPGLTSIEFEVLLPNVKYPFAMYKNNFQNAKYYLGILENLKVNKSAFQFIVIRKFPNGNSIFDTNIKVSIEDYTITDSTDEGFDTKVKIKLKQYREYSTKTVQVTIKQYKPPVVTRTVTTNNTAASKPSGQNYTVKSGDCLWNIAKKYYGNGSKYTTIYNANRDKIKNPNLIYPGQVLWIPA